MGDTRKMTRRTTKIRYLLASGLAAVALTTVTACGSSSKSSTATTVASGSGATTTSGSGSKAATGKPFIFLYDGDFTSSIAIYSQAETLGLQVAANELNASGGILGHPVKIEQINDQSNPTTAVNLLQQKLSSGDTPNAMYPGGDSETTTALLAELNRQKILAVDAASASSLNDPSKYPYYFGDSELTDGPLPAFLSLAKSKGYKKIAVVYGNDVTGQATFQSYKSALTPAGISVVGAAYDDTAVDMTPQLEQVRAQNPDALIVSGYGAPALYIIKGRNQLGWNIPSYADEVASVFPWTTSLPASALKNLYVEEAIALLPQNISQQPAIGELISAAQAMSGGTKILQTAGVQVVNVGYNAMEVVAYGAKLANSISGPAIAAALDKMGKPTNVPWVGFGPDDEYGGMLYTSTNHYPTEYANYYVFVPPGNINAQGLYEAPTGS
jgi:branched-chain amino acid transport system substrate-binding protein